MAGMALGPALLAAVAGLEAFAALGGEMRLTAPIAATISAAIATAIATTIAVIFVFATAGLDVGIGDLRAMERMVLMNFDHITNDLFNIEQVTALFHITE